MKFTDIFVGLFLAFDCFLPLYAILLSVNYMGSRDRDGDLSYSRFVGLLICTIGFAVLAPKNFAALSGVVSIASFAVFSILGLVTLVFLGLDMYRKANGGKNKGSLVIAVVIAVYVILVVFEPLDPERSRPESDFPDP